MIKFQSDWHLYSSVVPDNIRWQSATGVVHKFTEPFEWTPEQSSLRKPTVAKPNKWYGMPPAEIKQAWESENIRSKELGDWYHKMREHNLYQQIDKIVHKPLYDEIGNKLAPNQRLQQGIYPEHMVYLESAGICGQADYVEVIGDKIYVRDWKTAKEIKKESYVHWEKGPKKMLKPLQHLQDCAFNHYTIQLSTYMYIMLRHNPSMVPGDMVIEHIKFEEEGRDKYDYPIYRKKENGDYIVRDIEELEIPYLSKEVKLIIDKLKADHGHN